MSWGLSIPHDQLYPDMPSHRPVHISKDLQPPFPEWVRRKLEALYGASSEPDFNTAFENFVAKEASELSKDGRALGYDEFKRELWKEVRGNGRVREPKVHVTKVTKEPGHGGDGVNLTGQWSLLFEATAIPRHVLDMDVIEDRSLKSPHLPLTSGAEFFDRRRAVKMHLLNADAAHELSWFSEGRDISPERSTARGRNPPVPLRLS